jgi:N-acetylglutamate synthase-like GNAT family acetyltransferase
MPDVLQIRERPPHLSVVTLLEAEGLPASDLTESHLEHFFFTGSDGAPSALVGLEIYGEAALLRSLVVSAAARTQGLGSALYPIHARVREPVSGELRLHDQTTVNPTGAQ